MNKSLSNQLVDSQLQLKTVLEEIFLYIEYIKIFPLDF